MKFITLLVSLGCLLYDNVSGQTSQSYWNTNSLLLPLRLPLPPMGYKPSYSDLDKDGDPDILRSITSNGIPVQWIDDDDDMRFNDLEGDTDNDCLMIDRNKDGAYGMYGDLVIDWVAKDDAGNPAMQVVVDNIAESQKHVAGPGHYMWAIDTDKDNIFNYIDYNTFEIRAWIHNGISDFYEDYKGKSAFLKIHSTPERINDLRLNWENPFLFYDPDNDKRTEMAIRMVDSFGSNEKNGQLNAVLTNNIDWVSIALDTDNDNSPSNEFDYDMTIHMSGPGLNYADQKHTNKNMRGLPAADTLFLDARWRQLTELQYPDHDSAWDLIFKRGKWNKAWFVYDEDDDCNRWERVELYQPRNLFKIGSKQGGIDNNQQSDPTGDRGEWDSDNSGNGQLYVSPLDGKIHLYGAEWGAWRIDQNSRYYQGMGNLYDGYGPKRMEIEPSTFPTVKYTDTNNNGFFDLMEFDLNGDTIFDQRLSMLEAGLDDRCKILNTSAMKYKDFTALESKISDNMWKNAQLALAVAHKKGINTSWYALMMHPQSIREKYHYGFWLQFYIYNDLKDMAQRSNDSALAATIDRAYLQGNWNSIK